jgi:hypothetical protein
MFILNPLKEKQINHILMDRVNRTVISASGAGQHPLDQSGGGRGWAQNSWADSLS